MAPLFFSKPTAAFCPYHKDKKDIIMKWLTLEKIKKQCRIEPEFTDEDELLEMYGESAEEQVLGDIGRSYEDIMESYGKVPVDIIHATLLLVDQSYRQRSAADTMSWAPVPYAYEAKIKKYIRLTSSNYGQNQNQYGCKNL